MLMKFYEWIRIYKRIYKFFKETVHNLMMQSFFGQIVSFGIQINPFDSSVAYKLHLLVD